jgi:hypothetical protein
MAGRLIRYGYRSTSSCLLSEKTVRRDVVNPAAAVIAARGVMRLGFGPYFRQASDSKVVGDGIRQTYIPEPNIYRHTDKQQGVHGGRSPVKPLEQHQFPSM